MVDFNHVYTSVSLDTKLKLNMNQFQNTNAGDGVEQNQAFTF